VTGRYELPDGLSPEEERVVIAALERHFEERDARPSSWTMAGRIEATREGVLQSRRFVRRAWAAAAHAAYARRGTEPIRGRGDTA
jgi:hypothetical protein